MNSINLTGNICSDLELKQTTGGKSVVSFNLAVNRPFTKDTTDFIPIVVWEKSAEYLAKYAHKGTRIAVSGKLTTRSYADKNGNKRTVFEVIADTIDICDSARSNSTEAKDEPYVPSAYTSNSQNFEEISSGSDLPF